MRTISLETFHDLLGDAYAVSLNDTLYFVGYDNDGNPYVSDNDGGDYIDLSSVDGDIELDDYAVSFFVGGDPIRILFLTIKDVTV
jgi:hypothetical protein